MNNKSKDLNLLRKYIKESLIVEDGVLSGLGGIVKTAGKAMGFGGDGGPGWFNPDQWFSSFLDRQLDSIGKNVNNYLADKLVKFLPADAQAKIQKSAGELGEESVSTGLTKVVSSWISGVEDMGNKKISEANKSKIYDVAVNEYVAALKKDTDVKKALILVKNKLDDTFDDMLDNDVAEHATKKKKLKRF